MSAAHLGPPSWRWVWKVVTVAVATVAIGAAVARSPLGRAIARLDHRITTWVVDVRTPSSLSFARGVTRLGDLRTVAVVVAVAALLLVHRHAALVVLLGAVLVADDVTVAALKAVVSRDRPPSTIALTEAVGAAFPSGHAAQSVVCYGGLAALCWLITDRRALRWSSLVVAGALACTVGWSRVWLGVHWTSDVVAGWAIGAAWVAVFVSLAADQRLN